MKRLGTAKRILAVTTALLLLLMLCVLYFQVWKKPLTVDGGMAKHHLTFRGHAARLWEVQFSPDGELLASGDVDGVIKLWRKKDGQVVRTLEHPGGVTALAFSPDGIHLATTGYDSKIRLWRTARFLKPFPATQTLSGRSHSARMGKRLRVAVKTR
jgi:WD40 repeat protein